MHCAVSDGPAQVVCSCGLHSTLCITLLQACMLFGDTVTAHLASFILSYCAVLSCSLQGCVPWHQGLVQGARRTTRINLCGLVRHPSARIVGQFVQWALCCYSAQPAVFGTLAQCGVRFKCGLVHAKVACQAAALVCTAFGRHASALKSVCQLAPCNCTHTLTEHAFLL